MNEAGAIPGAMLTPFDALYEQPKPRFIFKMPRVVPDQKHKFENDDLFRRLSRESEVSISLKLPVASNRCVSTLNFRRFDTRVTEKDLKKNDKLDFITEFAKDILK